MLELIVKINPYFVCIGVLACIPVFVLCVCRACESQESVLDALGMELQTVVSCHVGAGHKT